MPIDNIGNRPVASTDMAQYAAPAADKGNAAKTGSANGIERELTAPSDARDQSVALRNAAGNNLRGAAHAGRESFMEKVGRWVKEGFLSQAGLPDTVTLHMPDGTTVEYSNEADRVFESNLDSTAHLGTRNYYDDFVPEGWHELKKL